jgi:uncharacterized membrane protein YfbV (UPF0208 family)
MAQYHSKYSVRRSEEDIERFEDPRVTMTTRLWGMIIPLFALSIPLVAIAGSDAIALPVITVFGAAIATITIWLKGGKSIGGLSPSQEHEFTLMRRSIIELSEQVAFLEQKLEDHLLSLQINSAAPQQQHSAPAAQLEVQQGNS